jgi:hypothetical protein
MCLVSDVGMEMKTNFPWLRGWFIAEQEGCSFKQVNTAEQLYNKPVNEMKWQPPSVWIVTDWQLRCRLNEVGEKCTRYRWVVKWRRSQCKSGTGNKETVPYTYDGEMMLQRAVDGDTNSKQRLREIGVLETKVYSNVTKAKRRTFWRRYRGGDKCTHIVTVKWRILWL